VVEAIDFWRAQRRPEALPSSETTSSLGSPPGQYARLAQ